MLDSAQFLERLAKRAGNRVRVSVDDLWRIFHYLHPKLFTSASARDRLMEMLNELARQEKIRLPQGKRSWDSSARTAIPQWLEIVRLQNKDARPNMNEIAWPPELQFAASLESRVHQETLLTIRDWLAAGGRKAISAPLKERSADIFGDEKRLEKLMKTSLFAPSALKLETLKCYTVFPDLVWKKGNRATSSILVLENSNTYHSFCRWNQNSGRYAACVYGNGYMIHYTHPAISQVLKETNLQANIEYFGDLDAAGIRIPVHLNTLLPGGVNPAETWYDALITQFEQSAKKPVKTGPGEWTAKDLAWFNPLLRQRIEQVFLAGYRLAQEFIGTEYLQRIGTQPTNG